MHSFDTNILAYACGLRRVAADEPKIDFAARFVPAILAEGGVVIAAQVLAELHNLLRRKGLRSPAEAAELAFAFASPAQIVPTDTEVLRAAFDLTAAHGLQTYDAIILAAAARAGCDLLFSEDMQDGFEWGGVRVIDPFA